MTVLSIPGLGRIFDKYAPSLYTESSPRSKQRQNVRSTPAELPDTIAMIKRQIAEFEAREGELPGLIVVHDLDLLFILSARRTYEKLRKDESDKLDEMRIFETAIQDLVIAHMKEYVRNHPDSTLVEVHGEEAEVKALALRIFELDTTARNRLVVCISECRSLYRQLSTLVD